MDFPARDFPFTVCGNPMKTFPARRLHITQCALQRQNRPRLTAQRTFGHGVKGVINQLERFIDFLDLYFHPTLDIAFLEHRNHEKKLFICGIRMIAPKVLVDAGSARDRANAAKCLSHFLFDLACAFNAVYQGIHLPEDLNDRIKIRFNLLDFFQKPLFLDSRNVLSHTAQSDDVSQEARAGQPFVDA